MSGEIFKGLYKQSNPRDPLPKSIPNAGAVLMQKMSEVSDGFSADAVVDAAANMVLFMLRQVYADRQTAEARFDELMGRSKTILLSHYDSVTGKRRNIFPFKQNVQMPLVHFKDRFPGK